MPAIHPFDDQILRFHGSFPSMHMNAVFVDCHTTIYGSGSRRRNKITGKCYTIVHRCPEGCEGAQGNRDPAYCGSSCGQTRDPHYDNVGLPACYLQIGDLAVPIDGLGFYKLIMHLLLQRLSLQQIGKIAQTVVVAVLIHFQVFVGL